MESGEKAESERENKGGSSAPDDIVPEKSHSTPVQTSVQQSPERETRRCPVTAQSLKHQKFAPPFQKWSIHVLLAAAFLLKQESTEVLVFTL